MQIILGLVHGVDSILSFCLLGFALFYCFILPAGNKTAISLFNSWPKKIQTFTGLALLSSLAWMILTAADMTESWNPKDLWLAMSQTTFGHLWCLKIILLLFIVFSIRPLIKLRFGHFIILSLVIILPLFSVLTGHSAAQEENLFLRIGLDLAHSISVGVWSGGLWALFLWLSLRIQSPEPSSEMSHKVVQRFSHFAMASTGIIFVSGLWMAYFAGVSIWHPLSTTYGQIVIGKLLLFCATLAIASVNQFIHLKNQDFLKELSFATSIRREVRSEIIFIIAIFILAGFLTRTSLPGS